MSRMKVTRILIYEGEESWIENVFQRNKISEGEPIVAGPNTITEKERKIEWFTEEKGKNG